MYRTHINEIRALVKKFNENSPFKIDYKKFDKAMDRNYGQADEGLYQIVKAKVNDAKKNPNPNVGNETNNMILLSRQVEYTGPALSGFRNIYETFMKDLEKQYAQKVYQGTATADDKKFANQFHSFMNQIYKLAPLPELQSINPEGNYDFDHIYRENIFKHNNGLTFNRYTTIDDYREANRNMSNAEMTSTLSDLSDNYTPSTRGTENAQLEKTKQVITLIQTYAVLKERNQKRNLFSWFWHREERNTLAKVEKKLNILKRSLNYDKSLADFVKSFAMPSPKLSNITSEYKENLDKDKDPSYQNVIDGLANKETQKEELQNQHLHQETALEDLKVVLKLRGLSEDAIYEKVNPNRFGDKVLSNKEIRKEVVKNLIILNLEKSEKKVPSRAAIEEKYSKFVEESRGRGEDAYKKLLKTAIETYVPKKQDLGEQLEQEKGMVQQIYSENPKNDISENNVPQAKNDLEK